MCFVYKSPIKFFFLRRMFFFVFICELLNYVLIHLQDLHLVWNRIGLIWFIPRLRFFPFLIRIFKSVSFANQKRTFLIFIIAIIIASLLRWRWEETESVYSSSFSSIIPLTSGLSCRKTGRLPVLFEWSLSKTMVTDGLNSLLWRDISISSNCFIVSQIATLYRETEE